VSTSAILHVPFYYRQGDSRVDNLFWRWLQSTTSFYINFLPLRGAKNTT
jgi:hypothetical protein